MANLQKTGQSIDEQNQHTSSLVVLMRGTFAFHAQLNFRCIAEWKTANPCGCWFHRGDVSPMLAFRWMQPVCFKANDVSFPKESPEELGHFVGMVEDAGHAMTFEAWKKRQTKQQTDQS